ncbi:GCN5-related N-acetyltransferase [Tolypothrix sp. NIES-4075]|uniref:GNAT family N-acetyltransferase n=1 Tax=Tolypothrix sp. NIES-4075 TaxID=2005459 RepID=UPI000B5CAE65|nr:GNAT family N-acetyltransferase [Tolypothrix sp. NIES-4075]GAX42186.1 GCN5-related N-acetyltransferase [Tolypothrix sp. NIES-4075]
MTNLLETERLIVRNWIPEQDAEQAFEIYGDPEVTYFLGSVSRQTSIESQRQRLNNIIERYSQFNNGTGHWAVVEKETATVVGAIILAQLPDSDRQPTKDYEIGWHLRRISWGKGYATEAGRSMLSYGFDVLQLPVIYAVIKPENHASIRVTQRLGMKPIGRTNKYYGIELLLFQLNALEGRLDKADKADKADNQPLTTNN